MTNVKRRSPVLAALASLGAPGLGQLYNTQPKKAIIFYLLSLLAYPVVFGFGSTFYGLLVSVIGAIGLLIYIVIDAMIIARRIGPVSLRKYNRWYVYVGIILVSSLLINPIFENFLFPFKVEAYKIPSRGMIPTLQIGDRIIADMKYYRKTRPKRGDVMIFKYPVVPSRHFIKRVMGLPGETVEIRDKIVYINGEELSEPYVVNRDSSIILGQRDNFGPTIIPEDSYFTLGDNRDGSFDSRFWGNVKEEQILGKGLYIYWSKDKGRIGRDLK